MAAINHGCCLTFTTTSSRSFTSTAIQDAYFPTVGGLSLAGRWTWRAGPWVSADAFSAGAQGELRLPDLDYGIPVSVRTSAVGVASGVSTGPRLVRAGAGVRLASTYLRRSFPGQEVAAQDLFTVAPGLVGFVSVNPGPYVLELELRGHYLPYRLDGADLGLGFTEAVLSFGYRL